MAVSIIIPVHNEAIFVGDLIHSIQSYLSIEYEIITVINGSTDDSENICLSLGCNIVSLPRKCYPSVARNAGLQKASNEIIIFLDADILVTKIWAAEVEKLHQDIDFPSKLILTGDTYDISTRPSWIENAWFKPMRASTKNYLNGGNILTNIKTLNTISGFNEDLETGEDVDLSKRAIDAGAQLQLNSSFLVHHEGYPKNIKNFYLREKWHGKGDAHSLEVFLRSKVALLSVLTSSMQLLAIILPLFIGFTSIYHTIAATSLLSVLAIYTLATLFKFGGNPSEFLPRIFLFFVYFWGRTNAIVDSAFTKAGKKLMPSTSGKPNED